MRRLNHYIATFAAIGTMFVASQQDSEVVRALYFIAALMWLILAELLDD